MKINGLRNKKIAIAGLGIENLSLVKFLLKNKIENLTILDYRDKEILKNRINELSRKKGKIKFILGKDAFKNMHLFQILFRSPGVPLHDKNIEKARSGGALISSPIKLFFDLCPCPIIGVTGTKGKGTTSTLIYEMLKKNKIDAYLGGNIGKAPFDFLEKLKKGSIVVLELSSFQLEDLHRSPKISVITNFFPEHLKPADKVNPNYHPSLRSYIRAKGNIVRWQKENDSAILNFQDEYSHIWKNISRGKIYYFNGNRPENECCCIENGNINIRSRKNNIFICEKSRVKLLGNHNLENICAASMAAYLAKAKKESIKKVIISFKGLEHRLEFVREVNGVKFFNDTFATIPNAAITAIRAFSKPIILILGGVDKGNDFSGLAKEIAERINIKALILIGKAADKIERIIQKAIRKTKLNNPRIIKRCETMACVIGMAIKEAESGDVVVLAPACASFDMFENAKHRGMEFKKEVFKL